MPIAADIGDCLFTAMEIAHTDLTAPGYYAGMGYGVPAGMGAQLATGRRALILVGDGAFQMTGWELGNCRRLGIDPVVDPVQQHQLGDAARLPAGIGVQRPRRLALRRDRGARSAARAGGSTTRAELGQALEHAVATRGRFQLIEAMLPRGAMSATLSRFVAGVKRLHAAKDAA